MNNMGIDRSFSVISGQDRWNNHSTDGAYLVVTVGADGIKSQAKLADKNDCIKAAAEGILDKIYSCKDWQKEELQFSTTYTPKGTLVKVMNALSIPIFQGYA